MGFFSNLFGGSSEEDDSPTVYDQPIVERDVQYDDNATPDETEENLMLNSALTGDPDCSIENELYERGWVNGRNGWVKYS